MKKRKFDLLMPLNAAVGIFLCGLLLGSVFTFVMQYANGAVEQEECTVVETQFIYYDEIRRLRRPMDIQEIAVYCSDGEKYFIDGVSINTELLDALDSLHTMDNITLQLHPRGNAIVEFTAGEKVLLEFEETIGRLGREADGFLVGGIIMYAFAIYAMVCLIWHLIKNCRRSILRLKPKQR